MEGHADQQRRMRRYKRRGRGRKRTGCEEAEGRREGHTEARRTKEKQETSQTQWRKWSHQ